MTKRPPRLDADPPWLRPARPRAQHADDLFHRVMAGVKPLRRGRTKPADPIAAAEAAALKAAQPARALHRRSRIAARPAPPPIDPAKLFQGDGGPGQAPRPAGPASPGLDKGTAQKLRRGRFAIDLRLDLHGLTQAAAHAALIRTLRDAHETGRRAVLVITGTGLRKKLLTRDPGAAQPGVLRDALPRWLAVPPLSHIVLAVSRARIEHGGDGAFYVLLRRARR